ncbi:DNA-binding transcriptional LysR family regulator [Novosphingobium sp. 1529]|uniref:LysR family transcriptional regulator n=1 Tax=Novosphingobium sp. 1529 TaxID=3156424 RepID=UPI00179A564F
MRIRQWDDLRIFLEVARHGRLTGAARALGLDHSTVSRRLDGLESGLGARLVDRSPSGARLTEAGRALLLHAERIEAETHAADSALGGVDTELTGTVRVATPAAFGTYLVAPRIPLFMARHPRIELELAPETRAVSLSQREADLAVTLKRPPRGRLYARQLAAFTVGFYAAPAYLEQHGVPSSVAELSQHRLISYIDDLIDWPELRYLDEVAPGVQAQFRCTSATVQLAAVQAGGGIGLLHTFAADGDPGLVRVLPDVAVPRAYWLVVHAELRRLPRVRAVAEFLEEAAHAAGYGAARNAK